MKWPAYLFSCAALLAATESPAGAATYEKAARPFPQLPVAITDPLIPIQDDPTQ